MPRSLWGEFTEDEKPQQNDVSKMVPVSAKRLKLSEVQNQMPVEVSKNVTVKVKNPLVTQTIEVMKQTEMLQSLIDTYSNKSGTSNYLLNPCQMIPEVNFPPENVADFVSDDKFTKPIWFVPPQDTNFAKGVPQHYPQVTSDICRASLRKAVCGQMRVAGFTDTAESALILFADACEEFILNLMQSVREVHANDEKLETQRDIEVKNLEKAYYSMTNNSLTQVHNYFKHHLIAKNRMEIAEFNGVFQEYDKLMKESQRMQKEEFHEGDFMNIFEIPSTSDGNNLNVQDFSSSTTGNISNNVNIVSQNTLMNLLDGQNQITIQQQQPQDGGGAQSTVELQTTYTTDINAHFQNQE
ncbi:spt7 [Haematobia irritans]|uniref:spt7 n=1 Tax=Haematobia irritans TaxID=7368 RepID=UPI003F50CED5